MREMIETGKKNVYRMYVHRQMKQSPTIVKHKFTRLRKQLVCDDDNTR